MDNNKIWVYIFINVSEHWNTRYMNARVRWDVHELLVLEGVEEYRKPIGDKNFIEKIERKLGHRKLCLQDKNARLFADKMGRTQCEKNGKK